ncbi:acyl-CoA thioesterase [Desulfobaculum bizertense]|uniref:Acyl-CoA thioester hydrolase n=1 Tax=Desulfobaculum bizertense DSM 18034 TaxID=1121442 RepID=A0A1T4VJL8_9BACT|nr:thioesterase family protein [Desulfobaculum bizertense]SKA65160.1 acyl-CoA thioester hydrolase [Desulfobaculum bizertense DSM 18034]
MSLEFPFPEFWYPHRVSYGETDAMKVLYNGEYLHIFERARNFMIHQAGISYQLVEDKGIMLPVRDAHVRYRRPIRFDQLIYVRIGVSEWSRASMTFAYEIFNEDKSTLHATGSTQHACTNLLGKPVRVPQWLRDLF